MLCAIWYHISAKDRVRAGDEIIKVYAMPQASADTGRLGWHFNYRVQISRMPFFHCGSSFTNSKAETNTTILGIVSHNITVFSFFSNNELVFELFAHN